MKKTYITPNVECNDILASNILLVTSSFNFDDAKDMGTGSLDARRHGEFLDELDEEN